MGDARRSLYGPTGTDTVGPRTSTPVAPRGLLHAGTTLHRDDSANATLASLAPFDAADHSVSFDGSLGVRVVGDPSFTSNADTDGDTLAVWGDCGTQPQQQQHTWVPPPDTYYEFAHNAAPLRQGEMWSSTEYNLVNTGFDYNTNVHSGVPAYRYVSDCETQTGTADADDTVHISESVDGAGETAAVDAIDDGDSDYGEATTEGPEHEPNKCSRGITVSTVVEDAVTISVIAVDADADLRLSAGARLAAAAEGERVRLSTGRKRLPSVHLYKRLSSATHSYAVSAMSWLTGGASKKASPFRLSDRIPRRPEQCIRDQKACLPQPYKAAVESAFHYYADEYRKLTRETRRHAVAATIEPGSRLPAASVRYAKDKKNGKKGRKRKAEEEPDDELVQEELLQED